MDFLLWSLVAAALIALVALLPDNLDVSQSHCTARESTLQGARALVLDNGVLRLAILPEYGGRLCSLFYRPANLELLATEFLVHGPPIKGFTVRGGWCAAFPSLLSDGEFLSHLAWEADVIEKTDDQVTARLWCQIEQVSHMRGGQVRITPGTILVERYVRLRAGESSVTVEDVLTNTTLWPMPTTWSAVVSLRARAGDRAVVPVASVEVQHGVGPTGNELDFGLMVNTPYQAFARNLQEGCLGFRPATAPVDVRLTFPVSLLPHAVIAARRDDQHPAEDTFRFQPLATVTPMATDERDGALVLPPKRPISLPIRLDIGAGTISAGAWSRPGLQLAEMITAQRVPNGRVALWRIGEMAMVIKTAYHLLLLLPEFGEDTILTPGDLPAADLILCAETPGRANLRHLVQRTAARFVGPGAIRLMLRADGVGDDRSIALSPGARFDLPGLGILATPAFGDYADERLGYMLQVDHLLIYHAGPTQFLGEFGPIGEQFHPQLVFLPTDEPMGMTDAVQAAKLLQPRLVVPLGSDESTQEFTKRCRAQHVPFAVHALYRAEGCLFDGWRLHPLG